MTGIVPWIFTALAVSLTAVGHLCYKTFSKNQKIVFLGLTVAFFISVPIFNFLALKGLTVAQVYLCTAFVPALTTFGAALFLDEKVTRHHLIGLALVIVGTLIYLLG